MCRHFDSLVKGAMNFKSSLEKNLPRLKSGTRIGYVTGKAGDEPDRITDIFNSRDLCL
jgi:hypothetical protein